MPSEPLLLVERRACQLLPLAQWRRCGGGRCSAQHAQQRSNRRRRLCVMRGAQRFQLSAHFLQSFQRLANDLEGLGARSRRRDLVHGTRRLND